MKKLNKVKLLLGATATAAALLFGATAPASAYTVDNTYALGTYEGSSQPTTGKMIVAHSTANVDASAANNAAFEKRTWNSNGAYVTAIAGDGIIYNVGAPGYMSWGAGPTANALAPVQVEMEESSNVAKQRRIYNTYVAYIRDMADKYGIPKTLDDGSLAGIKTHAWASNYFGETDHTDPYGALTRIGINQTQFRSDLMYGVSGNPTTTPTKPVTSVPAASSNSGKMANGFTRENGTFINGDTPIQVRYLAGTDAPQAGMLPAGASINYDSYINYDGYVWVHYMGYNGRNLYLPVHPSGTANNIWGIFK